MKQKLVAGILQFLICVGMSVGQDAECPVKTVWSVKDVYRETSATRDKICLNGYWKFWPAGDKLPAPDSGWCWQKVPGSWPASHRWGLFPYPFVPVMSKLWQDKLPIDITRGNWNCRNDKTGEPIAFDSVTNAWYKRKFMVPDTWQGRRIVLSAEFVERAAYIYIDGEHIGNIYWPYGELDITDFANSGEEITIAILVVATESGVRGLAGDLWIESKPAGATLEDIYLIPSVRNSSLTISAVIRGGITNVRYKLSGQARLDNKEVFSFAAQKVQVAENNIELTTPWHSADLWDFDNPNIHKVRISLYDKDNNLLDESLPIRFGFREFDINGKNFELNGIPVHFRAAFYKPIGASTGLADADTVERVVGRLKKQGYNLLVSSIYSSGPGKLHYPRQFLETCDAMGMAVQLQLNKATQFMTYSKEKGWQLPSDGLARWKNAVNPQIIRQRQHPALFFWAANANIFAGPEKSNPHGWTLNERPKQRMTGWDTFSHILEVSDAYIKSMDGARPVISLGNGNYKDVISTYIYPNFYPRQEQRELPSMWNKSGLKPLMIAEWGNPADISFSSHRDNKPRWPSVGYHAEPMLTEYSAIFDGDQAYNLDAAGVSLYQQLPQLHAQPFSIYHWSRQQAVRFNMYQNFFKTKIDALRQVMPIWRAFGVSDISILENYTYRQIAASGIDHWQNNNRLRNIKSPGVKPDNHVWYEPALTYPEASRFFEITELGLAWQKMSAPIICFIGGHPEQAGGIANRTANSESGRKLRSSLITVNDTLTPLKISCKWMLKQKNTLLDHGQLQYTVSAGKQNIYPLVLTAAVPAGKVTLNAVFTADNKEWQATRSWNILPAVTITNISKIVLYDPTGNTAHDFERLGILFDTISSDSPLPHDCRLLIIGQDALDAKTPLPFVNTAVQNGINILVLAQRGSIVSARLGFRYSDVVMRKLFIRRPGSPELTGIRNEMLHDWAGAGTLLNSYPDMTTPYHYSSPIVNWLDFKTTRFYHWGNTGSIGSVLIEKPTIAGFETVLDGAADLNYAGLLNTYIGFCQITLCQLDLIGRTKPDPVADRILVNLLRPRKAATFKKSRVCMAVGSKAADWLSELKIPFNPVRKLNSITKNSVVVLGPDAGDLIDINKLNQQVKDGICLLIIGWEQEKMRKVAGVKISTERKKLIYEPPLLNIPGALIGISPADLFWHGPVECSAIASIHEEKVATQNAATYWTPFGTLGYLHRENGEIVFLQPTPDDIKYNWQPHARDKILRIMGIVLSNWQVPATGVKLAHDLAVPPASSDKRWNAGYYSGPATLKDDVFRYHSW